MLDQKGFDLWADNYDKAVGLSDGENRYPFAGYKEILSRIYKIVLEKLEKEKPAVLDIGFGTGVLTQKLYEKGCDIWGQDFSKRMIELAGMKMPEAHLFEGDFSEKLADSILQNRYDFIIATYSLHHLTDSRKATFLKSLQALLKENGAILVGDVMFRTRVELERCMRDAGDEWDKEEIYPVFDELREAVPGLKFEQISFCAGLLTLNR